MARFKRSIKNPLILIIVLSGLKPIYGQELVFEHNILLPKNSSQVRNIADFNNDGKGDILVIEGEFEPTELAWFSYPDYKKKVINTTSLEGLHYVADSSVGDVDGDGDMDIIIPDAHEGAMRVIWFENPLLDPKGSSKAWTEHTIANLGDVSWLKDIEVSDMDKNGLLDVVVRAETDIYVLYQDSKNSWRKTTFTIKGHEGLAVGDIDLDGYPDIVCNGFWFKNPKEATSDNWKEYTFDAKWYNQNTDSWQDNNSQIRLGDINADGLLDIVISHSEKEGYPLYWYRAPLDPINGTWKEYQIAPMDYCHTVQIADFDNDGDLDILAAEMVKGTDPDQMVVFLNDRTPRKPDSWRYLEVTFSKQTVQTVGAYWAVAGDLGGDGDIDIVSSRSYDEPPIEIWENTISDNKQDLDKWEYIQVDNTRQAWGDFDEPEWLKYFGLAAADVSNDGMADIISGRYCYINPGGDMTGSWERVDFGLNVDALIVTDVDNDEYVDVIAQSLPNIYWLESKNDEGTDWSVTQIGQMKATGHLNSQGFTTAQIIPGGKPEILLEGGDGVYCLQIPASPEFGKWPIQKITGPGTHAEGIATGDVDGDGLIDIATGKGWLGVVWWKNPGDGSANWVDYEVGKINGDYIDKLAIVDINSDGKNDIVAVEELYPDIRPARAYWFQQPDDVTGEQAYFNWKRHHISEEKFTLNNMNVVDFDFDGDVDIVTAEHKGDKSTFIFENKGKGEFVEHVVGRGKEGHGGAFPFDLDNDGDYDIVNITFEDYKYLHVYRNDAIRK